ncbi:MAG: ATP-binding cassette domain-containing protein [Lachnospiraceae bacterium]|nr:ATP-binding cassette domain-containing protein [Lachnospiraceae bacterium]
MINVYNITKHYDDICALKKVNTSFEEGILNVIYGTSGSGKTTLVRIIGGIVRPDDGVIIVDDMPIYDNIITKKNMFLITEKTSFSGYMSIRSIARRMATVYSSYDRRELNDLCGQYGLKTGRYIAFLSKDERKLVSLIIGVAAHTKYLVCDDIFKDMQDDYIKKSVEIIEHAVKECNITPVVATSDRSLFENLAGSIYEL